jgi:hypothetical protein
MTLMKTFALLARLTMLLPLTFSETKPPQRITAADAKNHVGEPATVCGTVVASRISGYSVGDRGKPITFFLDKPEPNPVFIFVTLSSDPAKVEETKAGYDGKQVCVTGKITLVNNAPHIIAKEPSQIQVQTGQKK